MKTVQVRNLIFGQGKPKICVPLTGKTTEQLIQETIRAKTSRADLVEWRIDWFDDVYDLNVLEQTSTIIREILGEMPLLMTFRTKDEGGEKEIEAETYASLLDNICERKMADMIDIEAFKGDDIVKNIIETAERNEIITVGSNHDFDKTPAKNDIVARLCKMQELGFHITKIAVMPQKERDVLNLLDATLAMKEEYADRPFITMSMKKMGLISRMAGECFGSCLTFGTAGTASAPGQIDAEALDFVLDLLHE